MHLCLVPAHIHNQFLCLCHVELQILLTPCDKVVHSSPVLILITSADTSNYGRVIRKLLKMAGLCAIVEVCGLRGEEEERVDSSLWGPSVADLSF